MGKYIDRIIEVLDDNNVWKAVVLPRNEMGEKEESIVFGYLSDRNFPRKGWPMRPENMFQHRSIKAQSIVYR